MAKKLFKSYVECESAYVKAKHDADNYMLGMNDILRGRVQWMRERNGIKIGVSPRCCPLVIIDTNGVVSVEQLERWADWTRDLPYTDDTTILKSLANEATALYMKLLDAA